MSWWRGFSSPARLCAAGFVAFVALTVAGPAVARQAPPPAAVTLKVQVDDAVTKRGIARAHVKLLSDAITFEGFTDAGGTATPSPSTACSRSKAVRRAR